MALDNPVFEFGPRRLWPGSRVIELAVVVGLTLAVVGVAATWGVSSSVSEGDAVTSIESEPVIADESSSETVGALSTEPTAQTSAELINTQPASVASTVGGTGQEPMVPVQTGIVPGRPDPLDPAVPYSFERYQVQRGESLFSIASARGISVTDLVRWNWHLRENSVLIRGEWIWIPEWDVPIVADESGSTTEEGKRGRGGG